MRMGSLICKVVHKSYIIVTYLMKDFYILFHIVMKWGRIDGSSKAGNKIL